MSESKVIKGKSPSVAQNALAPKPTGPESPLRVGASSGVLCDSDQGRHGMAGRNAESHWENYLFCIPCQMLGGSLRN